ncbi:MAG: hypothetical protein ACYTG3_20695 [Planctomycetota bacterium]|jgi:hypothetical protein
MEETVLKFTTTEVTIELQGSEEFVERQIQFFRHYLEAQAPREEPVQEDEGTRLSLESFFQERASKAGRGAIQESLLLFGYYLQEVEGQPEFSIEQIGGCFGVVGRPLPKNLHHAVGTLKRKHRWFQEGSKRGYYRLSDRGRKLVRPTP